MARISLRSRGNIVDKNTEEVLRNRNRRIYKNDKSKVRIFINDHYFYWNKFIHFRIKITAKSVDSKSQINYF